MSSLFVSSKIKYVGTSSHSIFGLDKISISRCVHAREMLLQGGFNLLETSVNFGKWAKCTPQQYKLLVYSIRVSCDILYSSGEGAMAANFSPQFLMK